MMVNLVSVYCASSSKVSDIFKRQAFRLGELLAERKIAVKYGSGKVGLMGELAKGVLSKKGKLIGVIPQFMVDEGWSNPEVTEEIVTETMRERKYILSKDVDAVIALPGGVGTLEELMEVITGRQLGLFKSPVIIVNINHFYDDLLRMFQHAANENFMRETHLELWKVVDNVEDVLKAIENESVLDENVRKFAAI